VSPSPSDDRIAERYGRTRRTNSRTVLVIAIVLGLLVAVGVGWFVTRASDRPVRAAVHSWDTAVGDVLPTRVEIRRDAGLAVTCDLVAVDDRQIIVGQMTLEVPAGPDQHLVVEADIPLEGDGIAPELRGCVPAD
jgi:hypothetical protein